MTESEYDQQLTKWRHDPAWKIDSTIVVAWHDWQHNVNPEYRYMRQAIKDAYRYAWWRGLSRKDKGKVINYLRLRGIDLTPIP